MLWPTFLAGGEWLFLLSLTYRFWFHWFYLLFLFTKEWNQDRHLGQLERLGWLIAPHLPGNFSSCFCHTVGMSGDMMIYICKLSWSHKPTAPRLRQNRISSLLDRGHLLQWQPACFYPWTSHLLTPHTHPSGPIGTPVTLTISDRIHFTFQQSTRGISFPTSPWPTIGFGYLLAFWFIQRNISFIDGWWGVYEWK